MRKRRQEWGWRENELAEIAHGPFPSRKAAIAHARETLHGGAGMIKVGIVEYPRFEDWVDADWIVEHADETCGENEFGFYDDVIFERTGDLEQASLELKAFLRRWARKYVCTAPCWLMGCDNPEEDVILDDRAREDNIDSEVAAKRLAEIHTNPEKVLDGPALETKMAEWARPDGEEQDHD